MARRSRRSRHVTFNLPGEDIEKRLTGVDVKVEKLSSDVTNLKQVVQEESEARSNLQANVDVLKTETEEIKKYVEPQIAKDMPNDFHFFVTTMPCKSLSELDALVKVIENQVRFWQFTHYMKILGGNEFNMAIKLIIQNTLTRNVLKQLSWSGNRTTKPGLKKNYKLFVDAVHTVMQERFNDYTMTLGEEKMKNLIRSAARS